MTDYVTDTQALVKFMMGKRVINEKVHQIFLSADKGECTIIIPAVVLMEILYLFEKKPDRNWPVTNRGIIKRSKLPV